MVTVDQILTLSFSFSLLASIDSEHIYISGGKMVAPQILGVDEWTSRRLFYFEVVNIKT